ncbi:ATPase [Salmonella enterica subsp. arizonae]|uniref:ATPase n=1 Tax=Salmonella enterica subsp. arizonae TaxID=59203 RepID=A0A379SUA4_SALER|nr:ATPase [Salmonella enterica subsp. arizonae]
MKRLKTELNALVNRGVDRHLRLAVTGLSRSGKTAFITAIVNQLLNVHAGARLPLLSAVREERLLGVKRVPQRDFGIPRFTYDEGILQLYGNPPVWPRRRAASVRFDWHCAIVQTIRCCAILKIPQHCIWRSWIILVNGYSICPCWLRII